MTNFLTAIFLFFLSLVVLPSSSGLAQMRKLFGAEVNIQIDKDSFPSEEEIKKQDALMSGCQHGWFESTYKKAKLHYYYWIPKGEIKGVVTFHHGIGAAGGRPLVIEGRKLSTSLLSSTFLEEGIAVYSLELYGKRAWLSQSTLL